ncbi:prion-inhibition and propagation domain-containing protein [Trichoderma breve]|uniref:Prion-inhibition and propagation domain-containing protein n=1 Tax=Trichoderma breve TaxID=2034170 RepID=A0A9W9EAU6_9HYPO|nr:prion-inhibition and propagation domain-containing protein [Trichoderma breve]KAJ4863300.1 prion-inhibition and propagation domain-containing protein [Trichoderma breve]
MAEMMGIANGALSVAALFNNCVDTFEYIQLSRHFGEDYQRYQLKLDVAETRLGRWGEAVGINSDIRFASASPSDKAVKDALGILEDIADCFEAAQKKSRRYADRGDKKELMVHNDNDMNLLFQRLHKRSKDIARRRQKGISIVKKAAWALYDRKSLENIVNQITSWVDELEKLFPIELTQQKFIENEIKEVNDELSLKTLKDAARDIDPALERAVGQKVDSIEGKNSAGDITMEDKARFHVGNVFSEGVLQHEILVKDQASNSIETISAKNETRIQAGNVYGGKGIWDD